MATAEEYYQLGKDFFPKTKQTHSKAAIFCELLCMTQINLYKWISANQVPIQRSRRRRNTSFRGKTYAFELSSLDHMLPFSQGRKWKTKQNKKRKKKKKSQQGRSFVSGTLDWLVSCYNQNMLSWTMYETSEEKAGFAIILH